VTPILDGLAIVVGELLSVAEPRLEPRVELVPIPPAGVVSDVPVGADNVDESPADGVVVNVDVDPRLVPLPIMPVDPVRLDDELDDGEGSEDRYVLETRDALGDTDVVNGSSEFGVVIEIGELMLVVGAVEVESERLELIVVPDPAPGLGRQGPDAVV